MGGEPSEFAVRSHLEIGFPVYATEQAALTFHDNIEKVKVLEFGLFPKKKQRDWQMRKMHSILP